MSLAHPCGDYRLASISFSPFATVEVEEGLHEAKAHNERSNYKNGFDAEDVTPENRDDVSFCSNREADSEHREELECKLLPVRANPPADSQFA